MLCCVKNGCINNERMYTAENERMYTAENSHGNKGGSMDVGGQRSATLSDQLRLAANKGQLDLVAECLQSGASFDLDQDGRTALHYAALNGYTDVTRFLVEKRCDINIQDDSGYTALHRASSQGHVEVIDILLQAGCDVNTQDEHGNAAIHEAAWNGFSKTLELLVKYEVNCSIVNKAGFTALHLAAQNGHNESSRVLLYAACNSDLKNNYGDTTLHTGARYGHAGVTRILISARAKLNEQNKNGDTALHIASALKRRKIAKLLVESGIDVTVKNKQNETAVDVARRKGHEEIITIVQAYCRPAKQYPLKEVNFKMDLHEMDGPVVVPDNDGFPLDKLPDNKPEKGGKRFLFFKKKKPKDKSPGKGGVSPQGRVPGPGMKVPVGHRPVQGFFSKYEPREGIQYYRDLAGNVKQGPVGYTPTCNCLPAINKLQKEVHDTHDHVYDRIQSSNHVMHERINQVDHRASQRVQNLEKYTQDRFREEEQLCQQRINSRFDEHGNYYEVPNEKMKSQIQNWLEQKLEGYGHCLHHHHDDTALPNENIFSDIHETANGRLFKSRSDETLSQSDNHSGRYKKREFYESRQEAMQSIRAWQVPSYSKDRNRVKVVDRQVNRNSTEAQRRAPSRQQVNIDSVQARQYPMEPRVEVRNHSNRNPISPTNRNTRRPDDDQTYMTMTGTRAQNSAPPKRASLPQPQVYQSKRPVSGSRGPVNHSTPKNIESSPYGTHNGLVRSSTDGVLNRNSPNVQTRQLTFQDSSQESSNLGQSSQTFTSVDNKTLLSMDSTKSDMKSSFSDHQINQVPRSSSPVKQASSSSNANIVNTGYRNSSSSDKFLPETPKPTFTTFGYDDTLDGSMAPTNSPEYQKDQTGANNVTTPRSASSHSSRDEQLNKSQTSAAKSLFSRQTSRGSYGFTPSHQDDTYIEMKNLSPRMHQRTRSSEGLLETDIDHAHSPRSHSEDRIIDSRDATQASIMPRSVSESRGGFNGNTSPTPAPQQPSRSMPQSSSFLNRNISHPIYNSATQPMTNSTPHSISNTNAHGMTNGYVRPSERPVPPPKPSVQTNSYPYATVSDVKRERIYTGNINFKNLPRSTGANTNSVPENVYSTVKGAQVAKDRNHNNFTVTADVHNPVTYYTHGSLNGASSVTNSAQLEPRSKTAYQTYLTENPHEQLNGEHHNEHRESSPNVCNNSKEDSSSNPDSGYSSKIYGNRAGSVQPPSCGSTPSSSFSTDRGLTSNTNSPQSQYSNADYEYLPKTQYEDEVQTHVQSWYQKKLQETTQKVYDNWRSERSTPQLQQRLPARYYGKGDYASANQIQGSRLQQNGGQTNYATGQSAYTMSGQTNHMVSTFVVHGSDV